MVEAGARRGRPSLEAGSKPDADQAKPGEANPSKPIESEANPLNRFDETRNQRPPVAKPTPSKSSAKQNQPGRVAKPSQRPPVAKLQPSQARNAEQSQTGAGGETKPTTPGG